MVFTTLVAVAFLSVHAMGDGPDQSNKADTPASILAFNREHRSSFYSQKLSQLEKVLKNNVKDGTLPRADIWKKELNGGAGGQIPTFPAKAARWAQYNRRDTVWAPKNGVPSNEDPGRDKFPMTDDTTVFRTGCSRHHVCPNAVISSFWARIMSLTNEQRGAVKGLFGDDGFLHRMSQKFPDLAKFVKYTQTNCRDALTKCDASAVGMIPDYTDGDGHDIKGAFESTRFYDTLVYWPGNLFHGPSGTARADDPEASFETKACHTLEGGQQQYTDLKDMCEKMRRVITMPETWSDATVKTTSEACTSVAGVVKAYTKMSNANPAQWAKVMTCNKLSSNNCMTNNKAKTVCAPGDVVSNKGKKTSCRWVIKGGMCPGGVPGEQLGPCVAGDVNPEGCKPRHWGGTDANPFLSEDMSAVPAAAAATATAAATANAGLRGAGSDSGEASKNTKKNVPTKNALQPSAGDAPAPAKNAPTTNKPRQAAETTTSSPAVATTTPAAPRQASTKTASASAPASASASAVAPTCDEKSLTYANMCKAETSRAVCPCAGRKTTGKKYSCKSWAGCERADGKCVDIAGWTSEC